MDPRRFRAPFIPRDEIWRQADAFRKTYWPTNRLPVDVFEIAEFELELDIRPVPSLRPDADVDALLLGDMSTLVVDAGDFSDDRMQNRLRFSFAHEIGHLVLHRDVFAGVIYESVEDWVQFFEALAEEQHSWLEYHAYEFAGRLLVPPRRLKRWLDTALKRTAGLALSSYDPSGQTTLEYISQHICREFGVSGQVIEKRLTREGLWPPAE